MNERICRIWIWTSFRSCLGSLYSVGHHSFHRHNLIGSLSWRVRLNRKRTSALAEKFLVTTPKFPDKRDVPIPCIPLPAYRQVHFGSLLSGQPVSSGWPFFGRFLSWAAYSQPHRRAMNQIVVGLPEWWLTFLESCALENVINARIAKDFTSSPL